MITRKPTSSLLSSLLRPTSFSPLQTYICAPCQRRQLHKNVAPGRIPNPTPFVPDVPTFLTLIGRELSKHATKFKSWKELFTLSSPELKELGIEPPRTRRYLLRWRERFRNGDYGIGGDFKYVQDGVGEVRVVEVPSLPEDVSAKKATDSPGGGGGLVTASRNPGMTKLIVNVPNGSTSYRLDDGQSTKDLQKPKGLTLRNEHVIVGSYVQPVKGTNGSAAILKITEGMWEDRRGHKVHGGERRRAETLHKMRVAENKKNSR